MKKTSTNKNRIVSTLGLILCLGALPFVGGVTGCSTSSRYTRNPTEKLHDNETSDRITAALANDPLHQFFGGVNVVTYKEVVQLSGFVNTRELKIKAGDIARDNDDGREVRNNITVKE